MLENRRHFRLREFIDVAWNVEDQDVSGEGLVINISKSGLLLQTDKVFVPTDNCVLSILPEQENAPFGAKSGKMMWFRRIKTPQDRFQCGIQFVGDKIDYSFRDWLDSKVGQISQAGDAKILGNLAF